MQPVWQYTLFGRQFYDAFENAVEESLYDQWKTFENTHNMNIHMLCMWMENLDFLIKCIVHTELCQSVSCDMICQVRYNSNLFLCGTKKDNFQNMLILNWIDSNAI